MSFSTFSSSKTSKPQFVGGKKIIFADSKLDGDLIEFLMTGKTKSEKKSSEKQQKKEQKKEQQKEETNKNLLSEVCNVAFNFVDQFVQNQQTKKAEQQSETHKLAQLLQKSLNSTRMVKGFVDAIANSRRFFEKHSEYQTVVSSIDSTGFEHVRDQLIGDSQYSVEREKKILQKLHENYVKEAKRSQQTFKLFFDEVAYLNTTYPDANIPTSGDVWKVFEFAKQYFQMKEAKTKLQQATETYEKEYSKYLEKMPKQQEQQEQEQQEKEQYVKPLVEIVYSYNSSNEEENEESEDEVESVE